MPDFDQYATILAEIRAEWDQAEADIKLGELTSKNVVFPAIKELRYAGRRIVDALNAIYEGKDPVDVHALFQDARFDCHRARHDAIDAAFSQIAVELDLLVDKLGYDATLKAYPEYTTFYVEFSKSRKQIIASRRKRQDREDIYSYIEKVELQNIVSKFKDIKAAKPVIMGIARKERIARYVTYTISAAIIIIGLANFFKG